MSLPLSASPRARRCAPVMPALLMLSSVVFLGFSLASTVAEAQCAVCGNPAFSAGDNDIARAFGDGATPDLRLTAGLSYSYLGMSDLYTGATKLPADEKAQWVQTRDWGLRMHILSVMAGVEISSGTSAQLIVPMARADSTRADGESSRTDADGVPISDSSDYGLSDVELRVRQRLNPLFGLSGRWMPRMVVTVGAVAPSGNFIVKDTSGAISDQYVSLGRGTWWALAGLDFFGKISDRLSYALTNGVRYPLQDIVNNGYLFRWGTGVDSSLSANVVIVPGVLNAALAGQLTWRSSGKERISPGAPIEDFANGGGLWLGVNPTVQAVLGNGLSATVTVRVPVYRNVNGYQPVPGLGGVFALNWAWDSGSKADAKTGGSRGPTPALKPGDRPSEPEIAALLQPGKTTLVEYGASWCGVCKRLKPKLLAKAAARDDVVFRYVNVTDWPVAKMRRILPAQPGLPVLDVFGPDGRLVKRVFGEGCFAVVDAL